MGLLIGAGDGSKRQGFNREMKRRDYGEVTVVGVGFGPGKKKMRWPGSGVHSSARERPAQRTVSGGGDAGPWPLRWLGRNGSPEPFSIFFVLSSFLFLFSYFFCSFCTFDSNHFKPTL
jgi:hypothetical protein